MDTLTKFGSISRQLRMRNGYTLGDQSKHFNRSISELSQIETGLAKPDADYIRSFVQWTKASFVDHQELIKSSSSPLRTELPNDESNSRLYRRMNKLSPQQIRSLGRSAREDPDARRLLRKAPKER